MAVPEAFGQPPSKSRGEAMADAKADVQGRAEEEAKRRETVVVPPPTVPRLIIKARLHCPHCGERHEEWPGDKGQRWDRRAHTTHRCRHCTGDFDVYVSGASDEELDERSKA